MCIVCRNKHLRVLGAAALRTAPSDASTITSTTASTSTDAAKGATALKAFEPELLNLQVGVPATQTEYDRHSHLQAQQQQLSAAGYGHANSAA